MHEDRVIDLTCEWLSGNGYEINKIVRGNREGHDIAATGPNGARLYIECKGSTNKEGREFKPSAKYQNVTSAFFNQVNLQVTLREREPQSEVGMAFPDDNGIRFGYRFRMEPLRAFCERNRLRIFWVSENSVSEW
jgi:hypothetical protein